MELQLAGQGLQASTQRGGVHRALHGERRVRELPLCLELDQVRGKGACSMANIKTHV